MQTTSPVADFVVSPQAEKPQWAYTTESVELTPSRLEHFIEATDDDQEAHTSDAAARELPFGLKGRIVHGALVRDLAVNNLIRRSETRMLGVSATHLVIDTGGSYDPAKTAVYPGETIYVRYNRKGRPRKGTFLVDITYAVFVQRGDEEVLVMTGTQSAVCAQRKKG